MSVFEVARGQPLRGRLRVPANKSIAHRALLFAALAEGTSTVRGLTGGADVASTARAIQELGAIVDGDCVTGGRRRLRAASGVVDVGNSGTTIRLLSGLCASFDWLTTLDGDASIRTRPMDRVAEPLRRMGAVIDGTDGGRRPPLRIKGGALVGIDYELPVASAQVKGAVLLAGLAAEGETVVRERVATRAHSEEMLAACGADIDVSDNGLTTRLRPSPLEPFTIDVPGDPSQAAYWVVAACLVPGSDVVVENVYVGQARADFVGVLQRMGADVELEMIDATTAHIHARSGPLYATDVGGAEVPGLIDEIPILAVAAAIADGVTTFRDAAEMAVKESDRIAAVAAELGALGADIEPRPDGLVIVGGRPLRGALVRSHDDHRMAMTLAVAALVSDGPTRIERWEAVEISYPGFAKDLARLRR